MGARPVLPRPVLVHGDLKYRVVCEAIRRRISDGDFAPGSRLPPERKLPRMLGASLQTTRQALAQLVREGLIVRRQGSGTYVADRRHPPILPGRCMRLGVLWHHRIDPEDFGETYLGRIVRGIFEVFHLGDSAPEWPRSGEHEASRAELRRADNSVLVTCLGETAISQVRHPPLEAVLAGRFDGVLSVGIVEAAWLEELLALRIPTVLVDHLNDRFDLQADQVYFDPSPGYRAAVKHYASRGLRRIHFLGGIQSIPAPSPEMDREAVRRFRAGRMRVDPDSYLRLGAYRQAMDACGLDVPDSFVSYHNHLLTPLGEFVRGLANLPERERPEAVLCHSMRQAEELVAALAQAGLPVEACGVSDGRPCGPILPILADAQNMGAIAAELLISQWQRPGRRFVRVGVPMEFVPAPR